MFPSDTATGRRSSRRPKPHASLQGGADNFLTTPASWSRCSRSFVDLSRPYSQSQTQQWGCPCRRRHPVGLKHHHHHHHHQWGGGSTITRSGEENLYNALVKRTCRVTGALRRYNHRRRTAYPPPVGTLQETAASEGLCGMLPPGAVEFNQPLPPGQRLQQF